MTSEELSIENERKNVRWARVRALFEAALALPPDDRRAFVGARCEGDDAVRREVLSLLEHDKQAGEGFMRLRPRPRSDDRTDDGPALR